MIKDKEIVVKGKVTAFGKDGKFISIGRSLAEYADKTIRIVGKVEEIETETEHATVTEKIK